MLDDRNGSEKLEKVGNENKFAGDENDVFSGCDDSTVDTEKDNDEDESKDTSNYLDDASLTEQRFGAAYGIGKTITREGPGDGYASYPWALDCHERDLGLSPNESWLLKKMIKHVWVFEEPSFISMRKLTRESIISSATISKIIKSLKNKGFIRVMNRGVRRDRRIRYDIAGFYFALAYSIRSNPNIKYCKEIKKKLNILDSLGVEALNLVKDEIPENTRITIGTINDILNRKGFYIDWRNRYLKKLPDGPKNTNKLSTNDVKARIRGESWDDLDVFIMDDLDVFVMDDFHV